MKKIIMLALLAILGVAAKAQAPVTPEVRQEVEAIMAKTTDVTTLAELLKTSMAATLGGRMSAEKINDMCDELAVALYPDLIETAVTGYAKIFTLDELKEMNQFYNTPLGKKMAASTVEINQITTSAMSSPETQQKMMPIIMKYAM